MTFVRLAAAAMLSTLCFAVMAGAQALVIRAPAEHPPASHAGARYVDSRGCVFVRARVDGREVWAARVTREHVQVCGAEPTAAAGVAAVAARSAVAASGRERGHAVVSSAGQAAPPARAVRRQGRPVPAAALPGSTRIVPLHVAQKRSRIGAFVVPRGYRPAWDDDRLNPYRAEGTLDGRAAMNRIWTTTVPRRLIDRPRWRDRTSRRAHVYPYTEEDLRRHEMGEVRVVARDGETARYVTIDPGRPVRYSDDIGR